MSSEFPARPDMRRTAFRFSSLSLALGVLTLGGCSKSSTAGAPSPSMSATKAPSPDPRVGLKAGLTDAATAAWNMKLVSNTQPSEKFKGITNSDLAFSGKYVFQGSYNGYQVWDITNTTSPTLAHAYICPASQSDVSVYKNLLFVSGEGLSGRIDCGAQGVKDTVSTDRLRGVRIFDITDIANPKNVGNVQTCRGSHTHTVLVDPKDAENVYVYISGSSGVRSPNELAGCVRANPSEDPNSALFRIEVIKVPLKDPSKAAIVNSPRIFNDLVAPPRHGEAPEDIAAQKKAVADAKAKGGFTAVINDNEMVLPNGFVKSLLDSTVKARGGSGDATGADSAALRAAIQPMVDKMGFGRRPPQGNGPRPGPTQCHDITVFPAVGMAGGACEGYGLLLDISDPTNPKRIGAVADSNFSYWHSATFNNDGTKVLFSDEWGGGGQPKCRATDKKEWGADAIFTIVDKKMVFQSYYKMPAAQTAQENCVAHNGSLIPIPGRDVMVQAWYQGGISVFDWTDPKNAMEIAYFDRGPANADHMESAGSWSVYWYNGSIVSSEIARGLDIFELQPSAFITQNELDAAKSVHLDYLNAQGQPHFVWPASFSVAKAYLDQLSRSNGLAGGKVASTRTALMGAEKATGTAKKDALVALATRLDIEANSAKDGAKVKKLASTLRELSAM